MTAASSGPRPAADRPPRGRPGDERPGRVEGPERGPVRGTALIDVPETPDRRIRWRARDLGPAAWRLARDFPVTAAAVASAIAIEAAAIGGGTGGSPESLLRGGGSLLVIACLVWAERVMGGARAVLALLLPAAIAAPAAAAFEVWQRSGDLRGLWRLVAPLAGDPLVLAAGCIVAASAFFRPPLRRRVRVVVLGALAAFALFKGEPEDVARLLSACVGLGVGAATGPRPRAAPVPLRRSGLAAALVVLAAGPVIVAASRSARGLLEPLGETSGGAVPALLVPVALVAAAALLRAGGGRAPVVVGAGALLAMSGIAFVSNVVEPLREGWVQWTGLSLSEGEWQLGMLGSWLVPVAVLVVLLAMEGLGRGPDAASAPTGPGERAAVSQLVRSTDAGTLGHMATWRNLRHWRASGDRGAIAYRKVGRVALALSDPIATAADAPDVLVEFGRFCDDHDMIPVFYGIHGRHLPALRASGWHAVAVADEPVIDLADFTLGGRQRRDLRTAVNRAGRTGVRVSWSAYEDLPDEVRGQVAALWRTSAAHRKLPELHFTIGGLAELGDPAVLVAVAVDDEGVVHAVTSWLPIWQEHRLIGYTLDVMWRRGDAMPGAMELLVASAAGRFRGEGLQLLSLSATPMIVDAADRAGDRAWARMLALLARSLERAYGFHSLARFKRKLRTRARPLYVAFPDWLALPAIGAAILGAHLLPWRRSGRETA